MDDVSGDVLRDHGISWDANGRVMLVKGRRVELDSRSFAVLHALAAQFGTIASKDFLMDAAWPNQVVHENSLAKAISRLRRALDGSGIEIVASYGVGYLLRTTRSGQEEPDLVPDPAHQSPTPATPSRSRTRMTLLGAIALPVAAMGGILASRSPDPAIAIRDAAPITHDAPDARATILWVDDNPSNNRNEVAFLKRNRVAVHLAETTDDALNLLKINDYRLVVSDLGRGDDRLAGLKMIEAMKQRGMSTPVIIYTMRPDEPERQEAQRRLVASYGARDLALTPQEVREKVIARVQPRATNR